MNIRPLESLTKEELIELIKHERGHNDMVNDNAPAIDKTSDSALNAKYTDAYISGYVVACNFAASLAAEAWVNHVFHTGLDGLIERCKNMEQVLLEKAQACQESGRYKQTTQELVKHEHIADTRKMVQGEWKLVPVEPTKEMKTAAICAEVYQDSPIDTGGITWAEIAKIYKAMLAAAPQTGRISDDWKETSPDIKAIKKGDMRVINGVLMTCTDPEIGRWQGSAPQRAEPCATCNDMGAVGNILNAEPCPDYPPASTTVKDCLTVEPTDSEMLDWIENNARIDPDMSGNHTYWPTSFGKQIRGRNLRDAITKRMRGEE